MSLSLLQRVYLQGKITDSGNPVIEFLLAESGEDPARIASAIIDPTWSSFYDGGWADWIPVDIQKVWNDLPIEAQLVAYWMASLRADRESDLDEDDYENR